MVGFLEAVVLKLGLKRWVEFRYVEMHDWVCMVGLQAEVKDETKA